MTLGIYCPEGNQGIRPAPFISTPGVRPKAWSVLAIKLDLELFPPHFAVSPTTRFPLPAGALKRMLLTGSRRPEGTVAAEPGGAGFLAAEASLPAGWEAPPASSQVGASQVRSPAGSPERSRRSAPGMPWNRGTTRMRVQRHLGPRNTQVPGTQSAARRCEEGREEFPSVFSVGESGRLADLGTMV